VSDATEEAKRARHNTALALAFIELRALTEAYHEAVRQRKSTRIEWRSGPDGSQDIRLSIGPRVPPEHK
jgi:hypothetical protein